VRLGQKLRRRSGSVTMGTRRGRMLCALISGLCSVTWLRGSRGPPGRSLRRFVRALNWPIIAHAVRIRQLVKPLRIWLVRFLVSHSIPTLARDRGQARPRCHLLL
jgi:hypothetical protein